MWLKNAIAGGIGAVLLAWLLWHTGAPKTNFLVRCLLINLVVLLLCEALLYVFPGGIIGEKMPFGAMLGTFLLAGTNLGIVVYLGWRLWTTMQRA